MKRMALKMSYAHTHAADRAESFPLSLTWTIPSWAGLCAYSVADSAFSAAIHGLALGSIWMAVPASIAVGARVYALAESNQAYVVQQRKYAAQWMNLAVLARREETGPEMEKALDECMKIPPPSSQDLVGAIDMICNSAMSAL